VPGDDLAIEDVTGRGQPDGVAHQGAHDGVEELVRGIGNQLLLQLQGLAHRLEEARESN